MHHLSFQLCLVVINGLVKEQEKLHYRQNFADVYQRLQIGSFSLVKLNYTRNCSDHGIGFCTNG